MGFFSSLIGIDKPTKYGIASNIYSIVKSTINDIGADGLMAGSIVLNDDWTSAFRGGGGSVGSKPKIDVIIRVPLSGLVTVGDLQSFTSKYAKIDQLTMLVITRFAEESQSFSNLDSMFNVSSFVPSGNYVFVARSAQFREAEKKHEKNVIESLLRNPRESHYLLETYKSYGLAKIRERDVEEAGEFAGGVVDSFELPFIVM
jgi:hypothetical protein